MDLASHGSSVCVDLAKGEQSYVHEYNYVVPIQLLKRSTLQHLVYILNPYTAKNNPKGSL